MIFNIAAVAAMMMLALGLLICMALLVSILGVAPGLLLGALTIIFAGWLAKRT